MKHTSKRVSPRLQSVPKSEDDLLFLQAIKGQKSGYLTTQESKKKLQQWLRKK